MKKTASVLLCITLIFLFKPVLARDNNEITPYKFTDNNNGSAKISTLPPYDIPTSSRFTTKSLTANTPEIVYYLSKPKKSEYPIAVLCGGSSSKDDIASIIHFHRHLLQEFMDLDAGVLTIEQQGVDGNKINKKEFMAHYTRTKRLQDHEAVINHLKSNPPKGWNGKLVFLGVSEGGPIVTTLTTLYSDITIATINWSGAGDWPWQEELWVFLQKLLAENIECPHNIKLNDCRVCLEDFTSRKHYNGRMDAIKKNPTHKQDFLGMTYKYHADALQYPKPEYQKIRTPFLVVTGANDTIVQSSDVFVKKAKKTGAKITYVRVADMDHYIRKRQDIIQQSFEWLKLQLVSTKTAKGVSS